MVSVQAVGEAIEISDEQFEELKLDYMSDGHKAGLILYVILAPLSQIAFSFYIWILTQCSTVDVSVRFLSSQMSLCCLVCTFNQLCIYFYEILEYDRHTGDFRGFTPRLCVALWSGWALCGQMVLLIGFLMAMEIYLIAKYDEKPGQLQLRVVVGLVAAWIFSSLSVLTSVTVARDTVLFPICDPVDQSNPRTRFFVFGFFAFMEVLAAFVLRRADYWSKQVAENQDDARYHEVRHMVKAYERPINELYFYNLIQSIVVFFFYQFGDFFENLLSLKGVVIFNFWVFEFQHAFAGILGIKMVVESHPDLLSIAKLGMRRIFKCDISAVVSNGDQNIALQRY